MQLMHMMRETTGMNRLDLRSSCSNTGATSPACAVRMADPGDSELLLATLTSAFIVDPPVRWMYPEPVSYLQHYPAFARAFGGAAYEAGGAWRSDDFTACALWYPPGCEPDEAAVVEATVARHRVMLT